jgi:hypothetical protein
MKQIAVAFSTTGNSPKDGHQFSEIVFVGPNGEQTRFELIGEPASTQQVKFVEALKVMRTLADDAQLIVLNGGKWRRFFRAELRSIKRHGANQLMNNVLDVGAWAHQRFPRQRKDVAAIARRAGVEIPGNLTGLELEAELLRRIANVMNEGAAASSVADTQTSTTVAQVNSTSSKPCWAEQVGTFWRRLTGKI